VRRQPKRVSLSNQEPKGQCPEPKGHSPESKGHSPELQGQSPEPKGQSPGEARAAEGKLVGVGVEVVVCGCGRRAQAGHREPTVGGVARPVWATCCRRDWLVAKAGRAEHLPTAAVPPQRWMVTPARPTGAGCSFRTTPVFGFPHRHAHMSCRWNMGAPPATRARRRYRSKTRKQATRKRQAATGTQTGRKESSTFIQAHHSLRATPRAVAASYSDGTAAGKPTRTQKQRSTGGFPRQATPAVAVLTAAEPPPRVPLPSPRWSSAHTG